MGNYTNDDTTLLKTILQFLCLPRLALSKSGEVYVWGFQSGGSLQTAVLYANFGSNKIVDIHCCSDHAVVVTEAGSVQCFVLSEAYGSRNSHIARAVSQHSPVQALLPFHVQRVWIFSIDDCNTFNCNCCIVALTDKNGLYVCPSPSNHQRWVHHLGAIQIKDLDGKKLFVCCFKMPLS